MSLAPGTVLGPYQILAPLGAGGMGEVYRARDTRLGRDVAIKVLPDAFASDDARLARFTREAQTLASLNHPNIAAIFGFDRLPATTTGGQAPRSEESVAFLVMELVEGFDLSVSIARGPMPIAEVVPIARQIAEALEAAHEQGIVHRDLKPANVKVRSDGTVKVLDFGLAKATDPSGASNPNASHSPTLTSQGTSAGMIIGTAAYMSPEQAKGKAVDRRTDIWAFGVVLYEMLTGRRAFKGDDVSETLASVLKDTVPLDALPATTPPRLKRLIERCLDRDVKTRLRDIGEARVRLARIEAGEPDTAGSAPTTVAAGAFAWRRGLPGTVAALSSAALVTALAIRAPWRASPEPATPMRLSVELGADAWLATGVGAAVILSPDGKLLAFTAQKAAGQQPQLYVRRLEQLQASPLSGAEGARSPFFSPDSQWLGFFAEGKLKKVAVTGGAAVTLCDAPEDRGGTWSDDGTIFFTPQSAGGLSRVSSAGGTPEVLTTPDQAAGETRHRWPQALPGGKAVLFTAAAASDYESASIVVQSLPKGPRKVLQRGGYHGRYLRSGHIVYIHEGTLFAAPFDLGRLELTGPPAPVLEGVTANTGGDAGAQFAFSDRGTLVFLPGRSAVDGVPIQWMDKDGKTEPLRALAGNYNNIRFSPDGQKLAMDVREGKKKLDVWVYEWARDTMSRLTVDPGLATWPVWTPDGRRIAFSSTRADKATSNLYWQRADGTGEAQRLTESKNPQWPASWHPSGRFLAFNERGPQTDWDIMILPMEGDEASGWKPGKPTVFLNSPFQEVFAAFSPDGRWLAYQSDETGRAELYVRPFPGPGGKWQVSTGGGAFPTWSRNRKELFYRTLEFTFMVVPYAAEGDSFRAEKPRQWSPGLLSSGIGNRTFDLHPDGQRFAVLKAAEQEKRDKVVFIENFFDELRRVAPAAKR